VTEGDVRSLWLNVNGRRLHTRVAGERLPDPAPHLVFVHGLNVSSRYWVPLGRVAGRWARVFAPDLPGFGWSPKPWRVLSLTELTDTLAGWLRAAQLTRPTLVGNSFGCQIIVDLAVRHPDLLAGAVLNGPTVDPQSRTCGRQFVRWLGDAAHEAPGQLGVLAADYLQSGLRRLVGTLREAMTDHVEGKLMHVAVPTLVVRGARDPIVPQRWAEELTRMLPRGHLVVIPGSGHTTNYTAPLEMSRVMREFLMDAVYRAPVRPAAALRREVRQ
jgi:2-hydroxy-6-oxonona-2,4-dienedioate hydrolase